MPEEKPVLPLADFPPWRPQEQISPKRNQGRRQAKSGPFWNSGQMGMRTPPMTRSKTKRSDLNSYAQAFQSGFESVVWDDNFHAWKVHHDKKVWGHFGCA